jgi:hypothetical protein
MLLTPVKRIALVKGISSEKEYSPSFSFAIFSRQPKGISSENQFQKGDLSDNLLAK